MVNLDYAVLNVVNAVSQSLDILGAMLAVVIVLAVVPVALLGVRRG